MAGSVTFRAIGDWNKRMHVPLSNALNAAIETLGYDGYKACEKAIVYMAKSAGKETKQAPKLRKIVRNPSKDAARDGRYAPFGVNRYDRSGHQYFSPIYRGGEYGAKIKYISRRKVLLKVGTKWIEFEAGTQIEEFQIPGLMQSKKRIIRRSGLAKQSWMWGLKGFHKGAIQGVTDVTPFTAKNLCGIVLTNRLRYLPSITPANLQERVAKAASNSIMAQVAREVERKMGVQVSRLAESRIERAQRRLDAEFRRASGRGAA